MIQTRGRENDKPHKWVAPSAERGRAGRQAAYLDWFCATVQKKEPLAAVLVSKRQGHQLIKESVLH